MCNCQTMCRIPDIETENGRWAMPLHAPKCEDFKTDQYIRLEFDGSFCIMEPDDAIDYINDHDSTSELEDYVLEYVYLTKDQYENIPEFEGF